MTMLGARGLVEKCAKSFINTIEYSLVLAIEGVRRTIYLLDRRSFDQSRRILNIERGHAAHGGTKFVIFVIYTDGPLAGFLKPAFEGFSAAGYDIIAVLNKPCDASTHEYLRERTRLIIHRSNVGRDFGAYKDAISVLLSRLGVPERLIIANDSVFYLDGGLSDLIENLSGDDDFIGVSEVFDDQYHVGSYLLSFSRAAVASNAFQQFWEQYKPVSTRWWAILEGECGLTAALIKAGFAPRILFKAQDLRDHLHASSSEAFMDLVQLLPRQSRIEIADEIHKVLRALEARDEKSLVDPASPIIEAISASNQMHAGGFFFRRYLKLPIIKRDIIFRDLYDLEEVRRALSDLPDNVLDEITDDLSKRGSGRALSFWKRLLYRHGAI